MKPPRFPLYVISKGRADVCHTAKFLLRDRIPFRLVIEPQERELYEKHFPAELLLILPFQNLGLGSIPARNFVWQHSLESGHERHWIFDDNIRGFWRRANARKIRCHAGPPLRAAEAFADRYENLAITGFNYYMFSINKKTEPVFYHNTHVYSALLILNSIPHRWRGRYNEDTDLCLQVLTAGQCTVAFNAFLIWKETTMSMKGGNTAELYQGDGRLKMARALERVWPGIVQVRRRFGRPQHVIRFNWTRFDTPLRVKPGQLTHRKPREFGMKRVKATPHEATHNALA